MKENVFRPKNRRNELLKSDENKKETKIDCESEEKEMFLMIKLQKLLIKIY